MNEGREVKTVERDKSKVESRKAKIKGLADNELIRIAKDRLDRYSLAARIKAREMLKAKGYRFVGDRVEWEGIEGKSVESAKVKVKSETLSTLDFNLSTIKKEVTMATKIKKGHKACKNHPEKYAIKEGLCFKCLRERDGKPPYQHKKSGEVKPAASVPGGAKSRWRISAYIM